MTCRWPVSYDRSVREDPHVHGIGNPTALAVSPFDLDDSPWIEATR